MTDHGVVCCGTPMSARFETLRFIELRCETCKDVVYITKERLAVD